MGTGGIPEGSIGGFSEVILEGVLALISERIPERNLAVVYEGKLVGATAAILLEESFQNNT